MKKTQKETTKLVEQKVYKCKFCDSEYKIKDYFKIHEKYCMDEMILKCKHENEIKILQMESRLKEYELRANEAEIRADVAKKIFSQENNFLRELLEGKHAKFDKKELTYEMERIALEKMKFLKELKQFYRTLDYNKTGKTAVKITSQENICMMKLLYTNSTEENISMMEMLYPNHTETDDQNK